MSLLEGRKMVFINTEFPRIVQMELSTQCNLNCSVCAYSSMQERPKFFNYEVLKSVFPEILPKKRFEITIRSLSNTKREIKIEKL